MKNIFYGIFLLLFLTSLTAQVQDYEIGTSTRLNSQGAYYDYSDATTLNIKVSLWGFVKFPGRYVVPLNTSATDLLSLAGGPTDDAHSEIENLHFITAGTIPPNPSEILGSPQMEKFIEKLKSLYDIIILDSPPVIAVTDSEILSRMVDATVLVASANVTEKDLLEKSVELLTHDHGSFIGTVLNRFTYRSGYGSYYKYYYYYSKPDQKGKKPKAEINT